MWYLLERVSSASVKVDGEMISSIGKGLCVLVGIHRDDTKKEMEYIAKKILSIRLFDDPQTGKRWNKSVRDLNLEVLCVSQFTLHHILKVRNIIFIRSSTLQVYNTYDIYIRDTFFSTMMELISLLMWNQLQMMSTWLS